MREEKAPRMTHLLTHFRDRRRINTRTINKILRDAADLKSASSKGLWGSSPPPVTNSTIQPQSVQRKTTFGRSLNICPSGGLFGSELVTRLIFGPAVSRRWPVCATVPIHFVIAAGVGDQPQGTSVINWQPNHRRPSLSSLYPS